MKAGRGKGREVSLGVVPGKGAAVDIEMSLHLRHATCQTLDGILNATDQIGRDSGGRQGSGTSGPLRLDAGIKNKNTLETYETQSARGGGLGEENGNVAT